MSFTSLDAVGERFRRFVRSIRYRGSVRCPLCNSGISGYQTTGMDLEIFKRLRIIGGGKREDDECPVCSGHARTRLVQIFLRDHVLTETNPARVLHFAPEYTLYAWLKLYGSRVHYTACDIDPQRYNYISGIGHADMMRLPYEDDAFDCIICSHVLEHVPDDHVGMAELFRVLAPGGRLLALAPFTIDGVGTDEDPSVVDPEERERRFCQFDHVRLYDRDDFVVRLQEAGFSVELFDPFSEHASIAEDWRLNPLELLPVAAKPSVSV